MRFLVTIGEEPESAPELWETHKYEIEAPDKEELEIKIGELLERLRKEHPGRIYHLQKVVCLTFRYVAQFAVYRCDNNEEFRRFEQDLQKAGGVDDESAKLAAKYFLELFTHNEQGSPWYTKLIKIIKITEEIVPLA